MVLSRFDNKLERRRAKSCQGRCEEVKVALLQEIRNEQFVKELGVKKDYGAFVNGRIQRKRACSVRVLRVFEEEEQEK